MHPPLWRSGGCGLLAAAPLEAIPQPSSASKPSAASRSALSTAPRRTLSVQAPPPEPPGRPRPLKPGPNNQRSMLEKLKLFNSKGSFKAGEGPGSRDRLRRLEILPSRESEEMEAGGRPLSAGRVQQPQDRPQGIAQRTFSRALTNKSSPKGSEGKGAAA